MADANTNSAQQAQDAQNFDNLTSFHTSFTITTILLLEVLLPELFETTFVGIEPT